MKQAKLAKVERREHKKKAKEIEKLFDMLTEFDLKEVVHEEIEVPKGEEHIDTFVVSENAVDDTLCLSQPQMSLSFNVSSHTITSSLQSVVTFPFKVCDELALEEVEGNNSLANKGISFVFHISLPSLASILRYTSIFSTSSTLNDLLFGSNSLIVNRFWIGKLGHLIIFCYNDSLSFIQIVDDHVIFVSLVWCVQHDIKVGAKRS